MWHQKAKGPPDGPPIFLIFVEKLNCPQSQAYQSISPVGTGLSLTDRALEVSLGTSIGNYSPLIAPQPVKLKIRRGRIREGSSPATDTRWLQQTPILIFQLVTICSGLIFLSSYVLLQIACPVKVSLDTIKGAGAIVFSSPQSLANTDFFRRVS